MSRPTASPAHHEIGVPLPEGTVFGRLGIDSMTCSGGSLGFRDLFRRPVSDSLPTGLSPIALHRRSRVRAATRERLMGSGKSDPANQKAAELSDCCLMTRLSNALNGRANVANVEWREICVARWVLGRCSMPPQWTQPYTPSHPGSVRSGAIRHHLNDRRTDSRRRAEDQRLWCYP